MPLNARAKRRRPVAFRLEERAEYRARRARAQLVRRMGVDPDNGWKAEYETLPGKEKVVDELRRFADRAERVYLATDLDREGEAIAWHLQELIGGDPDRFRRVVFSEITRSALEEAFRNPGKVDENRVNAQQARRFLDRVVGFELSPLLWAKVARNLSAGRVQSVAVRLIVEREREIRAFTPEEYWDGFADLARETERGDAHHRFSVARDRGKRFRPGQRGVCQRGPRHGYGGPSSQWKSARIEADAVKAQSAVHHVHPATGGGDTARLFGAQDHDRRAAPLRGGTHHLHAHGLDEPVGGRNRACACLH